MPTQIQTNRIIPRSILRHRPIAPDIQDEGKSMSSTLGLTQPIVRRHHLPASGSIADVPTWVQASQLLTRKRPSQFRCTVESGVHRLDTLNTIHPSASLATLVACGMGITLLLILLGQSIFGWGSTAFDDWRYGRPRTYQIDAYVGHEQSHQPSHFIVFNDKGRIEVLELPGNDASHAHLYMGPQYTGANADLIPATLQFVDPHHTHQPDMLIKLPNASVIFHNENGTFQLQGSSI